jgi:hypothetical protein
MSEQPCTTVSSNVEEEDSVVVTSCANLGNTTYYADEVAADLALHMHGVPSNQNITTNNSSHTAEEMSEATKETTETTTYSNNTVASSDSKEDHPCNSEAMQQQRDASTGTDTQRAVTRTTTMNETIDEVVEVTVATESLPSVQNQNQSGPEYKDQVQSCSILAAATAAASSSPPPLHTKKTEYGPEFKDQVRNRCILVSALPEDEKQQEEKDNEDYSTSDDAVLKPSYPKNPITGNLLGMNAAANRSETENSAVAQSLTEEENDNLNSVPMVRSPPTHRIAITNAPPESDLPCVTAQLVPGAEEEESNQRQHGTSKEDFENMLAAMKKEQRRFWISVLIAAIVLNSLLISAIVVAAFCASGSCGSKKDSSIFPFDQVTMAPSVLVPFPSAQPTATFSLSPTYTMYPTFADMPTFAPTTEDQTNAPTHGSAASGSEDSGLSVSGQVTIRLDNTPGNWTERIQEDYVEACDQFWEEALKGTLNESLTILISYAFSLKPNVQRQSSGENVFILDTTLHVEGVMDPENLQNLNELLPATVNENKTGFIATIQDQENPDSKAFFEHVTEVDGYAPGQVPLSPTVPPILVDDETTEGLSIGAWVGIATAIEVLICSGLYMYYRRWKSGRLEVQPRSTCITQTSA